MVSGLDSLAMMGEPVEEHGGHLCMVEDARPFAEGDVGGQLKSLFYNIIS
ncbi:hypothetical protein MESS4_p50003 [Mesorhizobium sp. STM 4661]|nr:hypothetical protein MESS4_p50003 [Mesorhizobium sp. STM 4661]